MLYLHRCVILYYIKLWILRWFLICLQLYRQIIIYMLINCVSLYAYKRFSRVDPILERGNKIDVFILLSNGVTSQLGPSAF